jgi:MFS family permease
VLRIGLVVFTVASLVGGLGLNAEMLIASRSLQGIGAALIAPNVLALIATSRGHIFIPICSWKQSRDYTRQKN